MGMHTSASRDRRSGRNSDTLTVRICLAALRKLLGCGSVIAGVTLTPDWLRALSVTCPLVIAGPGPSERLA